jgi:hypothetical protein
MLGSCSSDLWTSVLDAPRWTSVPPNAEYLWTSVLDGAACSLHGGSAGSVARRPRTSPTASEIEGKSSSEPQTVVLQSLYTQRGKHAQVASLYVTGEGLLIKQKRLGNMERNGDL